MPRMIRRAITKIHLNPLLLPTHKNTRIALPHLTLALQYSTCITLSPPRPTSPKQLELPSMPQRHLRTFLQRNFHNSGGTIIEF
ncbi:hypothetical protein ABVK25_001269 [Lepraria finkii]|uniref:Uncharacterized protein n=1 Tax=Lepraria finkii TaxID=1340010 RepID=A0ABR4BL67_9LECA